MEDIINSLSTYGYIILFFYSLGGGMVAIIAAGILSYAGKMDLTTSIAVAFVANALGDSLLFYISRYNKEQMMPYLKKHRRKLALSHIMMKKYGDKIIFFQKFVYGIKTLIPIGIGMTKYSAIKFNILNIISALIWAIGLGYLSFTAGETLTKASSYFSTYPWLGPLIVLTLLGGLWYYLNAATQKKNS
ncbi:DedA family protein [Sulfurospirillum arcachonense]|uniref:DedA family protein n=1 Tax=Sulfurospirillum arcachonense TaxID=57666 RepID=UPI0004684CB9|nr:DedA family protein [Sulfurospirillum arcachonense]